MKKMGTAWPTVLEIHDDFAERTHGGERIVGRVFTDGTRGEVEVLAPEYHRILTELFTQQQAPITGGGTAPDGSHYVLVARAYPPWKPETIDFLITGELARRSLRAVFVRRP